MLRLLGRLHSNTNPSLSLHYSRLAADLGDLHAGAVHAAVLDANNLQGQDHISRARLQLLSQVLVKLDPAFSYNSIKSEIIRQSGFIRFIAGIQWWFIIVIMIFLPPKIHGRRIPWKSWGKFFSRTRHVVLSVLLPLIQGFHHANTALARSAQMPARRSTSPIISCGVGWMLQRLFSTRRNIRYDMCSNKWILLIISMLCSLLKIKITNYVVLKNQNKQI